MIEAPNGRDLAFRAPNPNEVLFNELFLVDTRSGTTAQLTHERATSFDPAWSPDGRSVAFARISAASADSPAPDIVSATEGRIVLLDVANNQMREIDRHAGIKFQPRWSPDGTRLSYLASESFEGNASIVIVNATGNGDRKSVG